jgi:hypothetical protein
MNKENLEDLKSIGNSRILKVIVFAIMLYMIQSALIHHFIPAWFEHLKPSLIGSEITTYIYITRRFEIKLKEFNLPKVIFVMSILFTLYHSFFTLINVFTWLF